MSDSQAYMAPPRRLLPRLNFRIPGPLRPLFLKHLTRNSNLVAYAEEELRRAGLFDKDSDYGGEVGKAVMQMIRQFSDEEHSGGSAAFALALFQRLSKFQPLMPLTGENDEWVEISDGLFQNRRCSRVFKDENGAYDIEGKVFVEPSGATHTRYESRVPVKFPYVPVTEYVEVGKERGMP